MRHLLTEDMVAAAAPRDRPYKIGAGEGLYLFVTPTGAKSWRMKYRQNGQEHRLTFGLYPLVTLDEARGLSRHARALVKANRSPRVELPLAVHADTLDRLLDQCRNYVGDERLYFLQDGTGRIKVGVTKNVASRIREFQIAHADPLVLLGTLKGGRGAEMLFHRQFAFCHVAREWFEPDQRMLDFIQENVDPPCR